MARTCSRRTVCHRRGGPPSRAWAGGGGGAGAAWGWVRGRRVKAGVPPYRLLVSAMAALGIGVILFGGVQTIAGYSAITFVGALGFFLGKISADTIMQQALPDD